VKSRRERVTTSILAAAAALQISLCALIAVFAFVPFGSSAHATEQQAASVSGQPGGLNFPILTGFSTEDGPPSAEGKSVLPFDELVAPLREEAARRRLERARVDPSYAQRVDAALNDGRINFLFFGYGETYEPPEAPHFKGSINIFSLDLRTLAIATITLNHDIRAPEVERFRTSNGDTSEPTKIHMAYPLGGFDLMGRTVEDATALSMDFQLAMEDGVIKRAVDEVFGGLKIDVPFELDARPIYFEGVEHPAVRYNSGTQTLDGLQALQFIKAVMQGDYDPAKELTVRKQIVISAMMKAARRESLSPAFWARVLSFMGRELKRKSIVYDFDPVKLLFSVTQKIMTQQAHGDMVWPTMGQSVYVVDYVSGDGGVEWVTGSLNPIMQNDLAKGVYLEKSFSVPKDGADPYAPDLVTHYWPSVRALIRQRLVPLSYAESHGY
jgi:hypothetical protein